MKKLLLSVVAVGAFAFFTSPSFAADEAAPRERTLTGEAKCAKCALKESDKCQNVVEVTGRNGNKTVYYLVQNDVSKKFHETVCKETKKVTMTGTSKMVDGKREFTASKIEVAKE
jgi:hypothetical protein